MTEQGLKILTSLLITLLSPLFPLSLPFFFHPLFSYLYQDKTFSIILTLNFREVRQNTSTAVRFLKFMDCTQAPEIRTAHGTRIVSGLPLSGTWLPWILATGDELRTALTCDLGSGQTDPPMSFSLRSFTFDWRFQAISKQRLTHDHHAASLTCVNNQKGLLLLLLVLRWGKSSGGLYVSFCQQRRHASATMINDKRPTIVSLPYGRQPLCSPEGDETFWQFPCAWSSTGRQLQAKTVQGWLRIYLTYQY